MSIFGGAKTKKDGNDKTQVVKQEAVKEETKQKAVAGTGAKLPHKLSFLINPPHITEKAHDLTKYRQYIFNVQANANKSEVKQAIEGIYNVKVERVRTVIIHTKARRLGRAVGKKAGYKKAIVTLKKGYALELMPQ
ncbi:MAG TPA: 50S ribosomal protein L23 [Candidatus Paceibacterota bacterium]|nr:50S ribosomal protein L23 [Candidatus Paceibacterota bacterium]